MTLSNNSIVHVLGMGSMGSLLSVNMIKSANVHVIPLFRNVAKIDKFRNECDSTVGIRRVFLEDKPLTTVRIPDVYCPETIPKGSKIQNLVITTKTYQTKDAISPYLSYLDRDSNIIMVQNGLGVLDVLRDEIFTNPNSRPQLFQCVITHGAYQDHDFIFNHAGFADMKISRLPWDEHEILQTNEEVEKDALENSLIKIFMDENVKKSLDIKHMTYQELLLGQLLKFIMNSCINSVTAIVDSDNGEIVENCKPVFRSIIEETLGILRVAYKPLFEYESKYKNAPDYPQLTVNATLDLEHLIEEINTVACILNKNNSSSMRQDTRYLRDTEIDYINGYTVTLAKKLNLDPSMAKVNKTISELVELRLALNRRRASLGNEKSK